MLVAASEFSPRCSAVHDCTHQDSHRMACGETPSSASVGYGEDVPSQGVYYSAREKVIPLS